MSIAAIIQVAVSLQPDTLEPTGPPCAGDGMVASREHLYLASKDVHFPRTKLADKFICSVGRDLSFR
jgi:hypothetical protein